MPIYEYRCQSCGKVTEVLQRFEDPPPAACPACGGEVKKLLSAPAVQFKGSGWYVTDYAGKGKPSGGGPGEGKEGKEAKEGKEGTGGKEKEKPAASSASSSSGESGGSKDSGSAKPSGGSSSD